MRKVFKMDNLDCANCAAKMETAISKLPGVKGVQISFMTQKMILETDEDKLDGILAAAQKAIKGIEPDCAILV